MFKNLVEGEEEWEGEGEEEEEGEQCFFPVKIFVLPVTFLEKVRLQ